MSPVILRTGSEPRWQMRVPVFGMVLVLAACNSASVRDAPGHSTNYIAPDSPGLISRVGLESQDIVKMSRDIVAELLREKEIVNRETPARILIEGDGLNNQSSSRVNRNMIANRIRVNLNKAAMGRILFVDRKHISRIQKERELKRDGAVDSGTIRRTEATAGVDYMMVGELTSDDKQTPDGRRESYFYISFELLDMEYGTIVWAGDAEFAKSGQPDVVYR